jgi:glycosyltransferase involved in cell wall biosynthesis
VRFFGNIPDEELAQVYDRSDIFALTSINHGGSVEGFGLVYLEAAAHSLPIVAHRVGGVSEAVRDGVTGLLVTPDRPAELAAAFEKLIHDVPLRRRLGDAGRVWAARNCWEENASTLFAKAEDAA